MNQIAPTTNRVHRTSSSDEAVPAEDAPTLMRVYEAIRKIEEYGQEPTRERIAEETGLKFTTVDDRIKVLRSEGMISPIKQCYRVTRQFPAARDVSVTQCTNGMWKIEIGDQVIDSPPAEAQSLALQLNGLAMQASALRHHAELQEQLLRIAMENRELTKRVKGLEQNAKSNQKQKAMAF